MSTTRCASTAGCATASSTAVSRPAIPTSISIPRLVDFNDSVPRYDFTMDLRRADLARLHVNRRDSVSQLSARIEAKAGGRSLDDLNGRIHVTDVLYRYNDKQLTSKSMTVTGENSARSKLVELRSDFADATFRSKTSYREVFEYLRRSAWKYLPCCAATRSRGPAHRGWPWPTTYSLLSVNIRHIDPITDAITAGLQVADGSSMQLLFNPASDQLSLKATSEYIERKRMLATRLSVNASNRGDSLTVYASAEDLYAGVLHLPGLSLTGGAKQGACSSRQASTIRCARCPDWWASGPTWWTSTGPTAASSTCVSCLRTSPAARRRGRFTPTRYSLTRRRS